MAAARFANQRALAQRVSARLAAACAGSTVRLRGSLAEHTDDAYSDIDLLWIVPDGQVAHRAAQVAGVLSPVAQVESIRSDPDMARSPVRRLLFVRFAGLPLYWRLDLDVRAASCADDDRAGLDDPDARGTDWSLAESAAMNAIAAVKALWRGRAEEADGLLVRGFARLSATDPGGGWAGRVTALASGAARREPRLQALAERIDELELPPDLPDVG